MLKITPKFKGKDLEKILLNQADLIEKAIENELMLVGLQFVSDARINADFTDHTGNLRSSIGFVLLKDGQPVHEDFETSKQGSEKTPGLDQAVRYAKEVTGAELQRGYMLVVVAGMEYAVFVESKGKDVLTGSSLKAEKNLRDAFENLNHELRDGSRNK